MKVPSAFSPLKLVSIAVSLRTAYSLGQNDSAMCIAHPDPHMTTFDGIHYDYQHGCDVVLIDSIAVKIQLRLVKYQASSPTFSSIERLAIHFQNGDTLEIDDEGDHFVNIATNPIANPLINSIGGFPFTKIPAVTNTDHLEYDIKLNPSGHFIKIVDLAAGTEGGGLGIFIEGHGSMFSDATGMCGKWNALTPGLYDRNGVDYLPTLPPLNPWSSIINAGIFGDLWQVDPTADTEHISTANPPLSLTMHSVYPTSCVARRRLPEQDRKLKTSPCEHCLSLRDLTQRENCEYDARVMPDGCSWVGKVPFYSKDDTLWYNQDDNCCLRRVEAEEGYQYVQASIGSPNSFGRKPCQHENDKNCFQKTRCSSDEKCWTLKTCNKRVDGVPCYREYECFGACVQQIIGIVKQGYKLERTEGPGYKYDSCDHNSKCVERKTCNGETERCFLYKKCSGKCFRDVKCPGPCSPTPSPTPIQNTESPTCTGDAPCFRLQEKLNAFKLVGASLNDRGAFSMENNCKLEECYQKNECSLNSRNCFVLKNCQGDACVEEVPCSSNCAPTSFPTKQKTKPPTKVPTKVPTTSPTAGQGNPWKCDGCKSMHKMGQVVTDGTVDFCKIVLKPKPVQSKDGRCVGISSENQCKESLLCQFKYKLQYRIKPACKEKKYCKIIVADAYTAGTSPPTPIVKPAKRKGLITTDEFFKVKCLCKTHTKVFKIECTSEKGLESKSVELDYTCSECDMKWLAEK